MQTSYFAKYKKDNGVSIALGTPTWFKGEKYSDLNPPSWLLKVYKDKIQPCNWKVNTETHKVIKDMSIEEAYKYIYRKEVLSKSDAKQVYKDLKDKVLLCWEKSSDFCHRHIVAKWIEEELGIKVDEYIG